MSNPVIYTWGDKVLEAPNGKLLCEPLPFIFIEGGWYNGSHHVPPCNTGTVETLGYGAYIWSNPSAWFDWSDAFNGLGDLDGPTYQFWFCQSHLVTKTDNMFMRCKIYMDNLFLFAFNRPHDDKDAFGSGLISASYMFAECSGVQNLHYTGMSVTRGVLEDVTSMFDFGIEQGVGDPPSVAGSYEGIYDILAAGNPQYHDHCFRGCPETNPGYIPASWR